MPGLCQLLFPCVTLDSAESSIRLYLLREVQGRALLPQPEREGAVLFLLPLEWKIRTPLILLGPDGSSLSSRQGKQCPWTPAWNLNGQHSLLPQTPYFLNLIHFCCCHSLPGHQGLTGPLYIEQGEEQIVPAFPPWNKSSKVPFISQFALIFLLSLMSASICHLPGNYCFFKIMNNFRHTTVYLIQNTSASMYHHSVFFLYH